MTGQELQSVLLLEIPEAEPLVAAHRRLLDSNASLGIPAHVTVLVPFVPPGDLTDAVCEKLARLFVSFPRFSYTFDHTDWFNEDVLWLGPRDPAPFRALTELVFAAFPGFPPFGGQYEDVIPHLTVGHNQPVADLRAAESAVRPGLPVVGSATAVTLLTGPANDSDPWTKIRTFPLGR
jgi:2'-5' RNA ligase